MAHHALDGYSGLVDRLNRFPQGAPSSDTLYKILKLLLDENEARLVSLLPIKPFTVKKASQVWKIPPLEAQNRLETMASRALLVDMEQNGETLYVLPPPMAGFFEFSMMRTRQDVDQRLLAELFYQYLNVEEEFIKNLFANGDTQLGRAFVHEPALPDDDALYVLDYERASEIIKTAKHRAVGICYCRHKMEHMNKACSAPMDICMTFGTTADSLARHGYAREIDTAECLDLLQQAYDHDLVQFGENVREGVNFICNCCGCCCEAMLAHKRFAVMNPIHTTNFLPLVKENCNGCGRCQKACPVDAIKLQEIESDEGKSIKKAVIDEDICLGCGVCVRNCKTGSIRLEAREKRVLTPLDSTHRVVMMAIERGKLQELIFDNKVLWSHRTLGTLLGAILNLKPVYRALASEQIKSRYLEKLIVKAKT
jgi:ferredoxin